MDLLTQARHQIDEVDREIAALFEKRMDAVKNVLQYKLDHDMQVLDSSREKAILERNSTYIQNEEYLPYYLDLQQYIMDQSKSYQKSLMSKDIVAYCGIEGAFSHMVSETLFPHNPKLQFNNFEDVFAAVANRQAQYGVIPFENTNSGTVGEVLDALLEYPVFINRVYDQKIEQCLLGVKGASLKDIEWVYSKDQALAQARIFLHGLQARPVPYPNTALAAQYVAAQQDKTKGAIAARENAVLYNLDILAANIEENSTNTTRFLVISLEPEAQGEKVGLIATISNEVGALHRFIQAVSDHGLNMCTIQSRPIKGKPFEYFFFIELEEIKNLETLEAALTDLAGYCGQIKVLGAYNACEKEGKQV